MSIRQSNEKPVHDSQGVQTNPTTSDVMADTGQLPPGVYELVFMASTDADARMQVEHRNAGNTGNTSDVSAFRVPANQTITGLLRFFVNKNERIRIMMTANLTGHAEASVNAQRIA